MKKLFRRQIFTENQDLLKEPKEEQERASRQSPSL